MVAGKKVIVPLMLCFAVLSISLSVQPVSVRVASPSSNLAFANIDPQLVQKFSLGQSGMITSLQWVATIFAYAEATYDGVGILPVLQGVRFVQQLEPQWETPYEFGAFVFDDPSCPSCSDFAESLLKESSKRFPSWKYKVYYGMFLLRRRNDTTGAINVLEPLSRDVLPDVPDFARRLSASIISERQGSFQAIQRMVEIAHSKQNAIGMDAFLLRQADALLRRDLSLSEKEAQAIAPILELAFLSADSREQQVAMDLLSRITDGGERAWLLRRLVVAQENVTAPESGSSRSP